MTIGSFDPGTRATWNHLPSPALSDRKISELEVGAPSYSCCKFPIPHEIGGRLTGVHVR